MKWIYASMHGRRPGSYIAVGMLWVGCLCAYLGSFRTLPEFRVNFDFTQAIIACLFASVLLATPLALFRIVLPMSQPGTAAWLMCSSKVLAILIQVPLVGIEMDLKFIWAWPLLVLVGTCWRCRCGLLWRCVLIAIALALILAPDIGMWSITCGICAFVVALAYVDCRQHIERIRSHYIGLSISILYLLWPYFY